jgi:hypothetical protein
VPKSNGRWCFVLFPCVFVQVGGVLYGDKNQAKIVTEKTHTQTQTHTKKAK